MYPTPYLDFRISVSLSTFQVLGPWVIVNHALKNHITRTTTQDLHNKMQKAWLRFVLPPIGDFSRDVTKLKNTRSFRQVRIWIRNLYAIDFFDESHFVRFGIKGKGYWLDQLSMESAQGLGVLTDCRGVIPSRGPSGYQRIFENLFP